jgi:CRISPR/Cas system endoribonuclease Cas6 (RAMP superfamily)
MEIQTYGKFVKEQKVRRYFAVCCFYRDSLFRKAAPEKIRSSSFWVSSGNFKYRESGRIDMFWK